MSIDIISPETSTYEGCPVPTKTDVVLGKQGVASTVQWNFTDGNGNPVDLSAYFNPSDSVSLGDLGYELQIKIQGCEEGTVYAEGTADVVYPETGLIQFALIPGIYNYGGIFVVSAGVVDTDTEEVLAVSTFLISLERTAFSGTKHRGKMPTIQEIRMRLADSAVENDLLGQVEFSAADIVDAIRIPVREWNETPPLMTRYRFSCLNFPYYELWMKGILYHLLRRAISHYQRVKLRVNHGGVSGDDREKDQEYMSMAELYRQEFRESLLNIKTQLNISQLGGTIASPYSAHRAMIG